MSKEAEPQVVWDKLSQGSRDLCKVLISRSVEGSFDIKTVLPILAQFMGIEMPEIEREVQELIDFGILEYVSEIQELRERLAELPVPPRRIGKPISLTAMPEDERKYVTIRSAIDYYERYPELHSAMEPNRFRVTAEFSPFLTQQKSI